MDEVSAAYRRVGGKRQTFARWWAKSHKRSPDSIALKLEDMGLGIDVVDVRPSAYPSYNTPLEMTGDALILTDVEFPFHHAEFLNRCVSLAKAWGVTQLILGGDVLHFESLSGWEPAWVNNEDVGSISEQIEAQLMDFAKSLGSKQQGALMEIIGGASPDEPNKNVSAEMNAAKAELRRLAQNFDKIDLVLGNHEGRLLRAMEAAVSPNTLLNLMGIQDGDPKWRSSPYYFSVLHSGGEKFQIEHPRNTAKGSSWKLASKFNCHIIQGHSHQLNFQFDPSGKYYAIECGHVVDEDKLPYASQRHTTAHAHVLGAVIVRDGFPYLLTERTDWEKLARAV